jgi:DNA-binding transcriptional ArsR family regulator
VGDLQTRLGIPLTTLSFHLKELSQVGLIKSRQLGRFIYYGPNFALMASLLDFLTEKCCANSSGPRACAISEARETLAKGATRRARKQEVV